MSIGLTDESEAERVYNVLAETAKSVEIPAAGDVQGCELRGVHGSLRDALGDQLRETDTRLTLVA